jgi:hypothetical protein
LLHDFRPSKETLQQAAIFDLKGFRITYHRSFSVSRSRLGKEPAPRMFNRLAIHFKVIPGSWHSRRAILREIRFLIHDRLPLSRNKPSGDIWPSWKEPGGKNRHLGFSLNIRLKTEVYFFV